MLTREDDLSVQANVEYSSPARNQRHLADFLFKCGQQLLRHPCGTEQPSALGAVLNLYPRCHKTPRRCNAREFTLLEAPYSVSSNSLHRVKNTVTSNNLKS